jgi:hypothetical protein
VEPGIIADLALRISTFIGEKNPNVALFQRNSPHVMFNEVNNAVGRRCRSGASGPGLRAGGPHGLS